ncbi:MAG: lipase family protein [Pyrinomonadaceae bacterium]|nr:lipase family protein [Pyrinomonadaceae bacterium]
MSTPPYKSLPMYFPSSPFSLSDAVMCSRLVNTAYDMYQQWHQQGSPSNPSNFKWTPNGPNLRYSSPLWGVAKSIESYPEPFAFAAQNTTSRTTYLAFRGSETDADFVEDADIFQTLYDPVVPGYGYVHAGFMDVYTRSYSSSSYKVAPLRTSILSVLNFLQPETNALYITGHSLGAGLSTLSVPDVATNSNFSGKSVPFYHYSLASPRVGDPNFALKYNFQLPVKTYRIVNTEDIVPDGPPSVSVDDIYEHVGTIVAFTAQYGTTSGNHDHVNSYYYALNNPNQPQGPVVSTMGEYPGLRMAAARRQRIIQKGEPTP